MISTKNDYLFYLREDCKVNLGMSHCGLLRMIVFLWYGSEPYMVYRYLRALRFYEYCLNCKRGLFGKLLTSYAKSRWHRIGAKYRIIIPPNIVGFGFRIPHIVGGVIVNCRSVGNYCTVSSGVIIGTNNKGGLAVIGNNVDISIGSKVIGEVNVGNNVIIAPNSVVVKDVLDNTIVTGIPAQFLKYNDE